MIAVQERAKLIAEAAQTGEYTARELAERFGSKPRCVRAICRRRQIKLRPDVRGAAAQHETEDDAPERGKEYGVRGNALPAAQALWQSVVLQAVVDATYPGRNADLRRERERADAWIKRNGRDFQRACHLAGMDPDFIHDAYVAGRVDRAALRNMERAKP